MLPTQIRAYSLRREEILVDSARKRLTAQADLVALECWWNRI